MFLESEIEHRRRLYNRYVVTVFEADKQSCKDYLGVDSFFLKNKECIECHDFSTKEEADQFIAEYEFEYGKNDPVYVEIRLIYMKPNRFRTINPFREEDIWIDRIDQKDEFDEGTLHYKNEADYFLKYFDYIPRTSDDRGRYVDYKKGE